MLFDYKPSAIRALDNVPTVRVNVAPGNAIEVIGRRYDLIQFHFHRPAEERIDGKQFDMVAHLVHRDIDGRLAVVAVLLEHGNPQPIVQTIWNNLPLEKGEEVQAKPLIDLNGMLPSPRGYYTYMDSLTTPPVQRTRAVDGDEEPGDGVDRSDRDLQPPVSDECTADPVGGWEVDQGVELRAQRIPPSTLTVPVFGRSSTLFCKPKTSCTKDNACIARV